MDLQPMDIVIHIINIVILYVILRLLLYKPISKFMSERRQAIDNDIKQAATNRDQSEKLRLSYEKQLAETDQKIKERLSDANTEANKATVAIMDEARLQAKNLLAAAEEQALANKKQAISDLESQIVDMAIQLAEQLVKREISAADNERLIAEFWQKME